MGPASWETGRARAQGQGRDDARDDPQPLPAPGQGQRRPVDRARRDGGRPGCGHDRPLRDASRFNKVDVEGTKWLLKAAHGFGVKHIVYVSIVGIDDNPFPYYQAKRRAERLIEESGIPYTVLRATQFQELVVAVANALTKGPIAPIPKDFRVQPVDIEAVAARLAELAAGEPAGRVRDIGGPQVVSLAYAVDAYASVVDRTRRQVQIPVPGKVGAAFRAGANLLGEHGDEVGESFSHHLVWRLET
ncbi:MAG: NAD(P)H-binding protein [Actinophytocola sp.]|nr:NAD(P)H-binding protein [Actinophytocola sp.]